MAAKPRNACRFSRIYCRSRRRGQEARSPAMAGLLIRAVMNARSGGIQRVDEPLLDRVPVPQRQDARCVHGIDPGIDQDRALGVMQ
jgi:hypothetical protein